MKTAVKERVSSKEECLSSVNAIQDALYVLNGKWKLPLLFTLIEKPRRFNEIQQEIEGISPKVLSKELKELELNGFVNRIVANTNPITIMYEGTPYGKTLESVLSELRSWGIQHREMIRASMRKAQI